MNKYGLILLLLLIAAPPLTAQDDPGAPIAPEAASEALPEAKPAPLLKLPEFEAVVVTKIREQFPRLPGYFTLSQSCHLPDYGPLVSVTVQPPTTFFVGPVLKRLEERQRLAEQQAQRMRQTLDRAAQVIRLRIREAELQEKISVEEGSRKKGKQQLASLQEELAETQRQLQDLGDDSLTATNAAEPVATSSVETVEIDFDKMIRANYQELVVRMTDAIRNVLADKAGQLELSESDRVSIITSIRGNYLGNPDHSIVFVLKPGDIREFRDGLIDTKTLRERVIIQKDKP